MEELKKKRDIYSSRLDVVELIKIAGEVREKDYSTFLRAIGCMEYSMIKNKAQ
ncbi:hypothetical protein NYR90_19785 (plasmid) [Clostridioides difficile]|nr:hypothetical protein NYR90_19785 [Clostridioides difficile]